MNHTLWWDTRDFVGALKTTQTHLRFLHGRNHHFYNTLLEPDFTALFVRYTRSPGDPLPPV